MEGQPIKMKITIGANSNGWAWNVDVGSGDEPTKDALDRLRTLAAEQVEELKTAYPVTVKVKKD